MSEKQSGGKRSAIQALKFTLFSISAGIIQLGSYALLHDALHMAHWISYLISLVLSVLWNFTLNRKYTFRPDGNLRRAMLLVAAYYAVFTPVTTLLGKWLTESVLPAGFDWAVEIGTMLLNFVTEFLFQKYVVYREGERRDA